MSLREQNKTRSRTAILEAATLLIAEQGAGNATARQIAERAGVSYQTLYNYYPSKAHIVSALLQEDVQHWSDDVGAIIKQYDGDLLATLESINQMCFDFMRGPKREFWRELLSNFANWDLGEDDLSSLNLVAHDRYHALLSMAQGMGELDSDVDLHLLAHTLFCLTDYAMLRFFISSNTDEASDEESHLHTLQEQRTLQEQSTLLLKPYLANRRPSEAAG